MIGFKTEIIYATSSTEWIVNSVHECCPTLETLCNVQGQIHKKVKMQWLELSLFLFLQNQWAFHEFML